MSRRSPRHAAAQPAKRPAAAAVPAVAPHWLHPLVLVLAGFTLLCCFSTSFQSNDGWWHLEMGKYILTYHRLPVPDPFGFATYLRGPAYPGEDIVRHFNLTQEWLTEVIFYPLYRLGGYGAIVLFRALILATACGAIGLVVWRRTTRFYLSIAAALAPATVLYLTATDRPHIFTIFFAAVFLLILDARRPLWLLPPLALVWANCHGGFIMSWILVGAFCAEALYQRLRGHPPADEARLWLASRRHDSGFPGEPQRLERHRHDPLFPPEQNALGDRRMASHRALAAGRLRAAARGWRAGFALDPRQSAFR